MTTIENRARKHAAKKDSSAQWSNQNRVDAPEPTSIKVPMRSTGSSWMRDCQNWDPRDRWQKASGWTSSRKNNKAAGFFNRLNDELFRYQQEIRDEFEEKGYVEIPDNFRKDNNRMMREAHRKAYLKVFGTEPPTEI
ncbi:hypothetical protein D1007_29974 [Hordeum vulgare]|nr:hypothetical protein D1007_29974 [Hordeum vulgare]